MGVWACVHYGVPNKGRLGSGVPHREPSVLHVIVEAVAGDLGATWAGGGGYGTSEHCANLPQTWACKRTRELKRMQTRSLAHGFLARTRCLL